MSSARTEAEGAGAAERVVLVDGDGRPCGTAEKLDAHRRGLLHRAFSVFVFNSRGQLLLQQRAAGKYHSAGLWSNTCCSHPRPREAPAVAAARRLREEMGFGCELREAFRFVYRVELEGGLIEHEYDHVFVGRFDGVPQPDAREVSAWRWLEPDGLRLALRSEPERFTYWLHAAVERAVAHAPVPSRVEARA